MNVSVQRLNEKAIPRSVDGHPIAGAILFTGLCYDKRLRLCRIHAIANGWGGMEWRVRRDPFDPASRASAVERWFDSYAEAMQWIG